MDQKELLLTCFEKFVTNISGRVRAVYTELSEDGVLRVLAYFYEPPTDEDTELIDSAAGEIHHSLWQHIKDYEVKCQYETDRLSKLPKLRHWIFVRAEEYEEFASGDAE